MCHVSGWYRGHSGDGCVLTLNLCKYDFRKGCLFVLSWERMRRVMRESCMYVVYLCRGCDGCCAFCLNCEAWSCKYSCM